MQKILFERALSPSRRLHYEFLDNDVRHGSVPLTVAFGWGGEMNILDVTRMLDICRYQKINVEAKMPDAVYADSDAMTPERNVEFLAACLKKFPIVNLAHRTSHRVYARFVSGSPEWVDSDELGPALTDPDTRTALHRVAPEIFSGTRIGGPLWLRGEDFATLGRWDRTSALPTKGSPGPDGALVDPGA